MKIRNFTPHAVRIIGEEGNLIVAIPSEGVARAEQKDTPQGSLRAINGGLIPTVRTEFGGLIGLPDPEEGVLLIVSNILVQAAKAVGRSTDDLLFPSGVPMRDAAGQIIGVRALAWA